MADGDIWFGQQSRCTVMYAAGGGLFGLSIWVGGPGIGMYANGVFLDGQAGSRCERIKAETRGIN
jgi:hypothetical protein